MKAFVAALLLLLAPFLSKAQTNDEYTPVEQKINLAAVNTRVGQYIGAGIVFNRTNDDRTVEHFVWTAGHLVAHARRQATWLHFIPHGPVTYMPINVSKTRILSVKDSNVVLTAKVTVQTEAEVVKYNKTQDLALLHLTGKNRAWWASATRSFTCTRRFQPMQSFTTPGATWATTCPYPSQSAAMGTSSTGTSAARRMILFL